MSDAIHADAAIDADPAAADPVAGAADPGPFDAGDAAGRNAVTHGLTARQPLSEEEAERMVLIAQQWTAAHMPETEPEEALINSAAIEYVRYLRCVDAEEARLGPAVRDALADWREKRRHAVRRKAQDLGDDPEGVAAALHETAFGIDWMLRHWRELLGRIDAGRPWYGDDLTMAMHLIGRASRPPAVDDRDGRALWETILAAFPVVEKRPTLGPAEVLATLREILADRIDRLEHLRPIVWAEVDEPEARAVETAALTDTSKEGQLRQRYRREAFRDWQKSLSMIMRLKVERSKIADRESRCDRREQASRPRSGGWARAAEPPAVPPAAPPPPAAPVDSRNEPPSAPESAPGDRRNPNPGHGLQPGIGAGEPGDPRRTGARTEAHQGPDARPGSTPRGASEGPGGLNRIEVR